MVKVLLWEEGRGEKKEEKAAFSLSLVSECRRYLIFGLDRHLGQTIHAKTQRKAYFSVFMTKPMIIA